MLRCFACLMLMASFSLGSAASTIEITSGQLPSSLTLVNFDNLSNGEQITNQYPGVTFTTAWGDTSSAELINGASGVVASNFDPTAPSCACQPLTIAFSTPVTDLGFLLVSDPGTTIASVTATDGTTSFNLSASVLTFGTFVGFENSAGITSLTLTGPPKGELSLDNLRYGGSVSAPEPSALLLLAVGGLAIFRRRLI